MRSISLRGVCKVPLTLISTLCTSFVLLIAGGTLVPGLPFVGAIGTVIYRTASPASHVGAGSPPTLVAFGEHDHLLPASGQRQLANRLTRAGVENVVVAIPYMDHAYDLAWGGLGTQITRHQVEAFLRRVVPPFQNARD